MASGARQTADCQKGIAEAAGGIAMENGAESVTVDGDIVYIAVAGDVEVGRLNAANGNVGVLATGSILDTGDTGGADITANETTLLGDVGIGSTSNKLDLEVAVLEAESSTGGVFLQNTGAVAVNALGAQPTANALYGSPGRADSGWLAASSALYATASPASVPPTSALPRAVVPPAAAVPAPSAAPAPAPAASAACV